MLKTHSLLVGALVVGGFAGLSPVPAAAAGVACGPTGFDRNGRPDWLEARMVQRPGAALPDWVRERRELGTAVRHAAAPGASPVERTGFAIRPVAQAVPDWVQQRRDRVAERARPAMPARPPELGPQRAAPPLRARPEPPGWVSKRLRARVTPDRVVVERSETGGPPVASPRSRPLPSYRWQQRRVFEPAPPPPVGYGLPYAGWGPPVPVGPGWAMPPWGGFPGAPWGWAPPPPPPPVGYPVNPDAAAPADAAVAPVAAAEPAAASVVDGDQDADGVGNAADLCADTPPGTAVDAFGCAQDVPIVLRGVNFHADSAELTADSTGILDRVGATLVAHPQIAVEVAGHTDSDGDAAYNKDLSQRRAETVMAYLADIGVAAANMTAVGHGEEQPVADNDTPQGKAENRRVELNRR